LIEIVAPRDKLGIAAAATKRTAVLTIAIVRIVPLFHLISGLDFGPEPQVYSQPPKPGKKQSDTSSTPPI